MSIADPPLAVHRTRTRTPRLRQPLRIIIHYNLPPTDFDWGKASWPTALKIPFWRDRERQTLMQIHTQVAFTCENTYTSVAVYYKGTHIGTVTIVLRDSINWILNGLPGDAT